MMGTITTSTAVYERLMRTITGEADHSGPVRRPDSTDAAGMTASDAMVSQQFGDLTIGIHQWMEVI